MKPTQRKLIQPRAMMAGALALAVCGITLATLTDFHNPFKTVPSYEDTPVALQDAARGRLLGAPTASTAVKTEQRAEMVTAETAPIMTMERAPAIAQDMATESLVVPSAPVANFAAPQALTLQAVPGRRMAMDDARIVIPEYLPGDRFEETATSPIRIVAESPVSTFSADVDTASYATVRRQLNQGIKPNPDTVRIEELINYFDYAYPLPEDRTQPFQPTVAVYPSPWAAGKQILHIGIKGYDVVPDERPRSNLVFLLDVSGSMNAPDKLPLLKTSLSMLVETLSEEDSVAIVVYAGAAGTVLEPTPATEKDKILSALANLQAGGSTAGAAGIRQAYALAEQSFIEDGVNRVILATDGDFNVGISNPDQLKDYIAEKRDTGVFLSVLGFGQGNYHDALMQALAQNGNGNAAYIDTVNEARKVLVDEASSTLFPIAKDVKFQVEFNPARVAEYRLIGYETRMLNREDFNNDKIDAGDMGAGHTVTALYEITPVGSAAQLTDPLRYGTEEAVAPVVRSDELAFLKMRYKLPDEDTSRLITRPVTDADAVESVEVISPDIRFAAAVAGFGQLLRGGAYSGDFSYDDVMALIPAGDDPYGLRSEFRNLVRTAKVVR